MSTRHSAPHNLFEVSPRSRYRWETTCDLEIIIEYLEWPLKLNT